MRINRILFGTKNDKPVVRFEGNETKEYLLINGFNVFKVNEILNSLDSDLDINFKNFKQYYNLLKNISNKLGIKFEILYN